MGKEPKPPGPGERPARLVDVARLANVSRATAARALGGYGFVSDDARIRIEDAARSLDYRANDVARAMRAGRTSTIGVVVADIANSFFSGAARAMIDTAARAGYQTLLLNSDDVLSKEVDAVRVLVEKRVDGLIVVPSSPTSHGHLTQVGEHAVPVVLLDRRVAGSPRTTVGTDDRAGARAAIELFGASGHTRVGLLVATAALDGEGPDMPAGVVSTVLDRVEGARDGLRSLGLEPEARWTRFCRSDVGLGREAALRMLGPEPRPSAILATNEEMALGVLAACGELGLRVGRDLSLISFDDSPWASVFVPGISVVRRPVAELGRTAVANLLAEMRGEPPRGLIELPVELVARQSVHRA